jgi:hypothetical protein
MGMLIFTHDAEPYRIGNYVEGREVLTSPSCEGLTVIVHDRKPKKSDYEGWLDLIAYRMVVVCESAPKFDDERVIVEVKKTDDTFARIRKVLMSRNRSLAWKIGRDLPVPLMLSMLRENNRDIDLWRLLAHGFQWVGNDVQMSAIIYGSPAYGRPKYPKKKKAEEVLPAGFRESDRYADIIVRNCESVANDIRVRDIDTLPKKVKKKKQKVMEWL